MKDKPRLLYIHTALLRVSVKGHLNVTFLQVMSMCNALAHMGYEVTLALQVEENLENIDLFVEHSFSEEIMFSMVSWQRSCSQRLFNRILNKKKIVAILRKVKPDLVYTREPIIIKSVLNCGYKVIYESHHNKLHGGIPLLNWYLKKQLKRNSKHKNFLCLFSISLALSNYWREYGINNDKLFHWHDGFEHSMFENEIDKLIARADLNLPKDKTIVTYLGGLYANRRIGDIIKLAANHNNALFVIVGGPEENKIQLQNTANNMGVNNITFVGSVERKRVPIYLFASDVLLALWSSDVPTINYCSPLKLFEYMASGKIILAHAFPTIKEVLSEETAILCNPDDFDDLDSKLTIVLRNIDLHQDKGKKARIDAFEHYAWNNRAKMILKFIEHKL